MGKERRLPGAVEKGDFLFAVPGGEDRDQRSCGGAELVPRMEMARGKRDNSLCGTLSGAGLQLFARKDFLVFHVAGLEREPDAVRYRRADRPRKEDQKKFCEAVPDRAPQQQIFPVFWTFQQKVSKIPLQYHLRMSS